jgi:hypothetical protein
MTFSSLCDGCAAGLPSAFPRGNEQGVSIVVAERFDFRASRRANRVEAASFPRFLGSSQHTKD